MLKITEVEQRSIFFRELTTMVQAGLTIAEALDGASRGTRHFRLHQSAVDGAFAARHGKPFSQTMGRFPDVFTPVETAMIRAGEETGRLDSLLGQIAAYLETEYSLRQMISRETFYPKILFGAILAFMLVVPSIIKMVTPGGSVFRGMLLLAEGVLGVVVGAAVIFAVYIILRHLLISSRELGAAWDQFKLRIPVFGEAIRRLALARFSRGLAALFAAGVEMTEAASIAADLTGNQALRLPMKAAVADVEKGMPISQAFAKIPAMDDLTLRMLQTGEQTGNIDVMMQRVAEHYEEAALSTVRRAGQLTVPIAVVIAGIFVFFLMLQAYTGGFSQLDQYTK